MKSRKVLIGVIVAFLVGGVHFATAQPKANYQNNLIEIGPDNIAGRVRALVVDQGDPSHNTLYAGGVAGGLYMKSGDYSWRYMSYHTSTGAEITLPISCMIQLPNNDLLIGTGEGLVTNHGVNNDIMAPKGRGLFIFSRKNETFTPISSTNPVHDSRWSYINDIASIIRGGHLYIYAATDSGLFRWNFDQNGDDPQNPDWSRSFEQIASGRFTDVILLSNDNIGYATAPGRVYRIGDIQNHGDTVNITFSNPAFITASRVSLAAATAHDTMNNTTVHTTYLYAVVSDSVGLLDGVYLTKDQQNWTKLTTNTVTPFNSKNPGYFNSSIAIDPRNIKHVYVGGAHIWSGEGFVDNSFYTWTKSSYSESELNGGNYMSDVHTQPIFLHSGIHKIIPTFKVNNGDTTWVTYFATDGGVYRTGDVQSTYVSLNKGLNTVQFNHIAVTPDASIIGGAVDNSCPFIQSRNAHNGIAPVQQWYDDDTASVFNHMCNVLWLGNGGGVAASRFQMLEPYSRRSIFVSAEPGYFSMASGMGNVNIASFGRTVDDYADYNNTQTWTVGSAFVSDLIHNTNPIPQIKLWETDNNTIWKDTISFTIDTTRTYFHNGEETAINYQTVFQPGDRILVPSKPNFDFPFYHTFTGTHKLSEMRVRYDTSRVNNHLVIDTVDYRYFDLTLDVPNKVVSRAIVNGRTDRGYGAVYMNMTPNWYRNVWSEEEAGNSNGNIMRWYDIYVSDKGNSVGDITFSRDGRSVFFVVSNNATGKSFIFRIYNFEKTNVNRPTAMSMELKFSNNDDPNYEDPRITIYDTILAFGDHWFNRPISSITVDPRPGKDNLIVTFAGYNNGDPNIVLIENASDPNTRTMTDISISYPANGMGISDPVYSSLIEFKNGHLIVGTEKGVFKMKTDDWKHGTWEEVGDFNGVPVTSIIQQTDSMSRQTYNAREGVDIVKYLYAKTKFPYAIYYGTYGRGVFMDTCYVTNMEAEVSNPEDWVGITTVDNGVNSVKIYPNPAQTVANVELDVVSAGNAVVRIYDISGKLVHTENLGYLNSGKHQYSLDCQNFNRGMYLVNINFGDKSATSKLIVR
ncbi:MAG: T9SS type A sorting domain-containing protein [Bacteroidales bacterium]|nr:T9SS type A sorting domain-containing protein [Bacteroidales bacterium]